MDLRELSHEEMNNLAVNDAVLFFKSFLGLPVDFIGDDDSHPFEIFHYFNNSSATYINDFHLKVVYDEGGFEGGGEDVERVIAIINEKDEQVAFVKIWGSYYSYLGVSWNDEITQVYPHQVMVTQYKAHP